MSSWIIELRHRLAAEPPKELAPDEAARIAFVVPLYVESGELWTWLDEETEIDSLLLWRAVFPAAEIRGPLEKDSEGREGAWTQIGELVEQRLLVPPNQVLVLGQLDPLQLTTGEWLLPFVVAVPSPGQGDVEGPPPGFFSLPLTAFSQPRLVEERERSLPDEEGGESAVGERIYHVGTRRLSGPAVPVLESLLKRLGARPSLN